MILIRYTYILFVNVNLLFFNIAGVSALARARYGLGLSLLGGRRYSETPLHNLDDLANVGVDSNGSYQSRKQELEELLEDESQSPDEQSVSKYEENVKVFENPGVLEVTSQPTDDEVRDFQKVREHELASEDNHFDSLADLVGSSGVLTLTNSNLLREEERNRSSVGVNVKNDYVESGVLNLSHFGNNGETTSHRVEKFTHALGTYSNGANGLGNEVVENSSNDVRESSFQRNGFPPVTVKSNVQNHFRVFNLNGYPNEHGGNLGFKLHGVQPLLRGGYSTRECFERCMGSSVCRRECFCSLEPKCRCTKTYMMLVSMCETLTRDPDLWEFCSHRDVKWDHPHLNSRFSKHPDKVVADAFTSVQQSMCNHTTNAFCRCGRSF